MSAIFAEICLRPGKSREFTAENPVNPINQACETSHLFPCLKYTLQKPSLMQNFHAIFY